MSDLTPAAKKEIADAIAIVREDRFERHVRDTLGKQTPTPTPAPTPDPVFDPPKDPTPPPPPPKPPVTDPPSDPPKTGRTSAYWGEIFD